MAEPDKLLRGTSGDYYLLIAIEKRAWCLFSGFDILSHFWRVNKRGPDRGLVWNGILRSRSGIPDQDFVWNENARSGSRLESHFWLVNLLPIGNRLTYSRSGPPIRQKTKQKLNEGRYSLALNTIRLVLKNCWFWWGRTSKSGKNYPVMKYGLQIYLPIIDDAEFGFDVFGIIGIYFSLQCNVIRRIWVNGTQISHFIP